MHGRTFFFFLQNTEIVIILEQVLYLLIFGILPSIKESLCLVIKRSFFGILKFSIKFLLRCNGSNLSLADHLIAVYVQCETR